MPMNTGTPFRAVRYSAMGYEISWIDCQRHILGLLWSLSGVPLVALPFTAAAPMLSAQVVVGPWPDTYGYAGVAIDSSSIREQFRLPLPPWPPPS